MTVDHSDTQSILSYLIIYHRYRILVRKSFYCLGQNIYYLSLLNQLPHKRKPKGSVYCFSFVLFLRKLYKCRRNKAQTGQGDNSVSKSLTSHLLPSTAALLQSIYWPCTWTQPTTTEQAGSFCQFSFGCWKIKAHLFFLIPQPCAWRKLLIRSGVNSIQQKGKVGKLNCYFLCAYLIWIASHF